MTSINITLDDARVRQALQALITVTGHLEPALDAIGDHVANSIRLNFRGQHDPDNNAWTELSEATLEKRRKKGVGAHILHDTGILNRGITHNVLGDSVEIGSGEQYANMMHFGGHKSDFPWLWGDIPARPFVGVSEADKTEILAILRRYFSAASGSF